MSLSDELLFDLVCSDEVSDPLPVTAGVELIEQGYIIEPINHDNCEEI